MACICRQSEFFFDTIDFDVNPLNYNLRNHKLIHGANVKSQKLMVCIDKKLIELTALNTRSVNEMLFPLSLAQAFSDPFDSCV